MATARTPAGQRIELTRYGRPQHDREGGDERRKYGPPQHESEPCDPQLAEFVGYDDDHWTTDGTGIGDGRLDFCDSPGRNPSGHDPVTEGLLP